MSHSLQLSAKGLLNIATNKMIKDFTFILGNSRYECAWFIADFLSPKVSRFHSVDPSIEELVIETQITSDCFNKFISNCFTSFCSLSDDERQIFLSLSREFDNVEIYSLLMKEIKSTSTISEFYSKSRTENCFLFGSAEEIEILAQHFHELPSSVVKSLSFSTILEIFGHEKLEIEDEDWLFDFILNLTAIEHERIELLEFVFFEYLSTDKMKEFIEWSFELHNDFTITLWHSICNRLILPVQLTTHKRRNQSSKKVKMIEFNSSDPMQGIIAYLTSTFKGNVHTQGIVTITSSNIFSSFSPHHLADLTQTNFFNSADKPNQWFCYDFKDRKINLTHYAICSYNSETYNPRSWVIESSIDGKTWIENDRRMNVTDLKITSSIRTFEIKNSSECRFVRFRQIDTNYEGNHYLCLTSFEVFGSLIEADEK
jgi:hypothetical protein